MPDVYEEAYDVEDVGSFVRALESAEQYTAAYKHKMAKEGMLFLDSGITEIAAGNSFYGYVENPPSNDYSIIAMEPTLEAEITFELHAYFNADVDTTTFTETTLNNLNSSNGDFTGNTFSGPSTAVTINNFGTEFYTALMGTGKKSGGTGGNSLIANIEPGDNLLFEIRNGGPAASGSTGVVAFQAPYHEQNDEFEL